MTMGQKVRQVLGDKDLKKKADRMKKDSDDILELVFSRLTGGGSKKEKKNNEAWS